MCVCDLSLLLTRPPCLSKRRSPKVLKTSGEQAEATCIVLFMSFLLHTIFVAYNVMPACHMRDRYCENRSFTTHPCRYMLSGEDINKVKCESKRG